MCQDCKTSKGIILLRLTFNIRWQDYKDVKESDVSYNELRKTKSFLLKADRLGEDVIDNGKAFHIFGPRKSIVNCLILVRQV